MSRPRIFGPAVAAGAIAVALVCGLWWLANARSYQLVGTIVARVPSTEAVVALSFDDGPTVQFTDEVLSRLRSRGVKATFFVTGHETEAAPHSARKIVAEGHELGNHGHSHRRLLLMMPARIADEIERTDAAIREAGYEGEIFVRPPYGQKLLGLPRYLDRAGRTTIMWDVEPEASQHTAEYADRIAAHVVEHVRPGSIVRLHAMHTDNAESRRALPLIIDGLRSRGYTFVTVSELLRRRHDAPPPDQAPPDQTPR